VAPIGLVTAGRADVSAPKQSWVIEERRTCRQCGTELTRTALACPACHTLVHAERLRALAARAQAHATSGELAQAQAAWTESLTLLPDSSRQHEVISARVAELDARIAGGPVGRGAKAGDEVKARDDRPLWRRWAAGAGAIFLLLLGKIKFLLLGLTKLKTFASMFAFFGVYWTAFGWPLALGFVVGIYIHEMGHVAMLRKLGIGASAPFFIPGVGAFILAKQHITDPRQDAAVGLAGPVWGLGAGLVAYAVYVATGTPIWLAIAAVTGLINLFNLIPVWQLDGSRAFHALSAPQRWTVAVALGGAFWLSGVKMLAVIAAVTVWRALRGEQGPGDTRTLTTFLVLIVALSWMSALKAV
jgi:Zn-dependent protease